MYLAWFDFLSQNSCGIRLIASKLKESVNFTKHKLQISHIYTTLYDL